MRIFSLSQVLTHARAHSQFYANLYKEVPMAELRLDHLPIVDQDTFWKANSIFDNHLLTGPLHDAIVFKSGGTTGNPKFSVYTREEWESFTQIFGEGISHAAILPEDRVANLFYAGDLYASFLFIHESLERASRPSVNFPVAGTIAADNLAKIVKDFSINVLAGVPTTIMGFAEEFERRDIRLPSVQKIIFGGESLYSDQRRYLEKIFPGAQALSIGYASVDGGLLGYADSTCEPGEHRCFDSATIMEIIDEATGEVIHEVGKPGRLFLTNLVRKLMPIIRYPVGDRAAWVEERSCRDRKFILQGRAEEGARVGPASVYYDDIHQILDSFHESLDLRGFQLVVRHEAGRDFLEIRIAHLAAQTGRAIDLAKFATEIIARLHSDRPMLAELLQAEKIGPTQIEWVGTGGLETNARTGKLKRVIDAR